MQYATVIKYSSVPPPALGLDDRQVAILRHVYRRKYVAVQVGYRVNADAPFSLVIM